MAVQKNQCFGDKRLYIPIWFYSNAIEPCGYDGVKNLYIPIWFYSNESIRALNENLQLFTFQSGSIQIPSVDIAQEMRKTLHSNLVLFK